ncbi:MAG: MBL fold metallo-hydrolase [Candidatus Izemoplasmatales bacterium]|jgi:glyoxylase-like metal-dependent hydrolase (beta-lactamase superfamily II)|nr:MBL fold metallo-hydrolase [Candidatus Izemoplasmatales bacterium]
MKPISFHDNIANQNSYLLTYKNTAVVIDPGFNGEAILKTLTEKQLKLEKVLITHGHYDHLRDVRLLAASQDFLLIIHEDDFPNLSDSSLNYSHSFNGTFQIKQNLRVLQVKDLDQIAFGNGYLSVIHTPGHTLGSVCYLWNGILFSGDTLFSGDAGRTDLAKGSAKMMRASLIKIFTTLSNETIVYPGHEELTSLGAERGHYLFLSKH